MKVDREGEEAEYQPLSFWELKGYNTQRIQEQCEDKKEHPLLGTYYAVNISKKSSEHVQQVVEERLLTFESPAKQKVLAASSANAPRPAPVPLTSNMGIDVQVTNQKRKRSEMTEEEKVAAKEAAKAEREETKKRQKAETLASSAAAKLLPKLKATAERLNTAVGKLSQCTVTLPDASAEQVREEQEALQKAVANCTKLLATVSKGGAVDLSAEDLTEATEKSLNQRLKSANDAVRTAQAHVKSNKENAPASSLRFSTQGFCVTMNGSHLYMPRLCFVKHRNWCMEAKKFVPRNVSKHGTVAERQTGLSLHPRITKVKGAKNFVRYVCAK